MNTATNPIQKTYLDLVWSATKSSSGTAGCFLKAEKIENESKKYYKLSNYNSIDGIFGHESLNEKIASNLGEFFHFNCLHYKLITAEIKIDDKTFKTDFTETENFILSGEKKISFETFYRYNKFDKEPVLDFCDRFGLLNQIVELIIFDFITGQRDRHGANVEILENDDKVRLSPIYDNGVSFLFACYQNDKRYLEKIKKFDVEDNFTVQTFLGGYSLFDNLDLIKNFKLPILAVPDWEILFKGVDNSELAAPLSEEHLFKIWEMVEWRVNYYDRLCCR